MVFYKGTNIHRIFGYRSNVDMVLYLYDVLELQLDRRAREYFRKKLTPFIQKGKLSRKDARAKKIDFLVTAIYALRDRFRKMRDKQDKIDPTGCALVLRRSNRVDEFFEKLVGEVDEHQCCCREYSSSGYQAGWDVTVSNAALDKAAKGKRKTLSKKGNASKKKEK
jgi:hypothetical protein